MSQIAKIRLMISADVLLAAVHVPILLFAYSNSHLVIGSVFLFCIPLLILTIAWTALTARGYLFLRWLSGSFLALYVAFLTISLVAYYLYGD